MRPCLQKYISHPSLVIYFSFFFPQPHRALSNVRVSPVVFTSSVCDYDQAAKIFLTSKFSYLLFFFFFPTPSTSCNIRASPMVFTSVCMWLPPGCKKCFSHPSLVIYCFFQTHPSSCSNARASSPSGRWVGQVGSYVTTTRLQKYFSHPSLVIYFFSCFFNPHPSN